MSVNERAGTVRPAGDSPTPPAPIKSADRTLSVLEYFAGSPTARSLAEAARALEIPKSSLHGLLHNLHQRGWLSATDVDGVLRYRIGPQALTVGASYLLNDDILTRSNAVLDELSSKIGETLHLGELDGDEIVHLAKRDARHTLRLVGEVGARAPAYCTALGKVLLAHLEPERLAARLALPRHRVTSHSLVDEEALRADLEATRQRGYAIDNEESYDGVRCFAVPLGRSAPYSHALSCSIPVSRITKELQAMVISELFSAAKVIDG